MDRYKIYHFIHISGLASVLLALGSAALAVWLPEEKLKGIKKALGAIHGTAILAMLVSGFGMLAVLDIHGMPLWVWIKLAMWLVLAAFLTLSYRIGKTNPLLAAFLPLLPLIVAIIAGASKIGQVP